jgi:hypothetical protein|nr:hypothetical protein [uncultured Campylobacter sp.]
MRFQILRDEILVFKNLKQANLNDKILGQSFKALLLFAIFETEFFYERVSCESL